MNRFVTSLAIVVGAVSLFVTGCSSDSVEPKNEETPTSFIEHTDLGCITHKDMLDYESYLVGYTLIGDTLTLEVHFWLSCGAMFDEVVTVEGNNIAIAVRDTLNAADCNCNYENTFRFLWNGETELSLQFDAYRGNSQSPTCEIDTLIIVSADGGD
jgi:hypothetical protein